MLKYKSAVAHKVIKSLRAGYEEILYRKKKTQSQFIKETFARSPGEATW